MSFRKINRNVDNAFIRYEVYIIWWLQTTKQKELERMGKQTEWNGKKRIAKKLKRSFLSLLVSVSRQRYMYTNYNVSSNEDTDSVGTNPSTEAANFDWGRSRDIYAHEDEVQTKGIRGGANVRSPLSSDWEGDRAVAPQDPIVSRDVGWRFNYLHVSYLDNLLKQ